MTHKLITLILLAASVGLLGGCDAAEDVDDFRPSVTADQVVDRATLRTFVEEARRIYPEMLKTQSPAAVSAAFRQDGGYWKYRDIYIFILDLQGVVIVHGGNRSLEGEDLYDRVDLNGVVYTQELLAAARRGGDYVEYYFDNPDISGDEVEGSLKVGYAVEITAASLNGGRPAMIGSGFYP